MAIKHLPDQLSDFLRFLASETPEDDRVPPLTVLSRDLGVSVASLREQLEVARAMGWVEVKPKVGIRRLPFSFRPVVEQSLAYAVAIDSNYFSLYSTFRNHIEASFWYEAVTRLEDCDKQELSELIDRAYEKLQRDPIQIPHQEHRELHLSIYKRLDNPFVTGSLEAYWNLYEAVGLDVYADLKYLQQVWNYHRKMVEAIIDGKYDIGFQMLNEHMDLLKQRDRVSPSQLFE